MFSKPTKDRVRTLTPRRPHQKKKSPDNPALDLFYRNQLFHDKIERELINELKENKTFGEAKREVTPSPLRLKRYT